jgi:hypothetical protein
MRKIREIKEVIISNQEVKKQQFGVKNKKNARIPKSGRSWWEVLAPQVGIIGPLSKNLLMWRLLKIGKS